ncbi:MAG: glycosyltransferase, partial [Bacteroidetes bacterium]
MNQELQISVVIPLFNEEDSLPELCQWIRQVMEKNSFSYEIMLVDDGSTDNSWEVVRELSAQNQHIRGIKFNRNYGKSAALHTAFQAVSGKV